MFCYDYVKGCTSKRLGDCKKYLTTNGVILVPEIIAKEVECEEFDGKSVEYDFGGDADCWVDVVLDKNHIALESLKSYMNEE